MNMYEMRREFDRMVRTAGLDVMDNYRDNWINMAWQMLTEMLIVPSLKKTITFDSIANQSVYEFPYDYGGTDIGLKYKNRRLDPVEEESLILKYERRTGNQGIVRYYDWYSCVGEDLLTVADCTLTNGSKVVQMASTNTLLNSGYWVRFDPYVDATNAGREDNVENMVDPGDYGYQIDAGEFVSGTSFSLTQPFRGPTGDGYTVRLRPAETQQFIVYGMPTSAETDAFSLRYYALPKRLYNNTDVPEWPSMGMAIIYLAIALGLEWHHNIELSNTFFGRSMQRTQGLERRKKRTQALVSDVTIGGAVGRITGMRGVWMRGRYR